MSREPIISTTGYWDGRNAHLYHGYSRALVNWIASYVGDDKNERLYDFGCGTGQYLRELARLGFTDLVGYEGSVPLKKEFDDIRQQDLTQRFEVEKLGNVLCLEVMEHIPAKYEQIVLDNIARACDNILILSWAVRGQSGIGHVNERDNEEACDLIRGTGFVLDTWATQSARVAIPYDFDIPNAKLPWFKNTVFVFNWGG